MYYLIALNAVLLSLFVWARWFWKNPEIVRLARLASDLKFKLLDATTDLQAAQIRSKQYIREDDLMNHCLRITNHNDAQHELIVDFVLDLQKMCDRYERRGREVDALGVKGKPPLTVMEDGVCKTQKS